MLLVNSSKWPMYSSQKCYGHRDKIPIYLHMKNKYSANVIHHIWIPYSNGSMLKTIFLWTLHRTAQYQLGDFIPVPSVVKKLCKYCLMQEKPSEYIVLDYIDQVRLT